ncbi:MAG: hypothetical protein M3463_20690 [Verrucomicrobiota bacterium]|nr:hypothetical protein [Verrucomicrobiota bacterium]
MRRGEMPGVARFQVELKELLPRGQQVIEERAVARFGEVGRRPSDLLHDVFISLLRGGFQPALFAGDAVEREVVLPRAAGTDPIHVQRAVDAVETQCGVAKDRRCAPREPLQRGQLGDRHRGPGEAHRRSLRTFHSLVIQREEEFFS